jgi:hypothetical protein
MTGRAFLAWLHRSAEIFAVRRRLSALSPHLFPECNHGKSRDLALNFLRKQSINRIVALEFGGQIYKIMGNSKTLKGNRRDSSESSRRQHPRLKPSCVPFLKSVIFNQGCEAQVVNISRGGILLKTEVRLRPQMKIFLKLVTSDGIITMEGHVLRSSISSLDGVPRYQSAISFEHPFNMLDDLSSELEEQKQESQPKSTSVIDTTNDLPSMELIPGSKLDRDSAILTVIAQDGISAQDMFKLNDW